MKKKKLIGKTCTANKCITINTDVTAINRYHQFTSLINLARIFFFHFFASSEKLCVNTNFIKTNEMCRMKANFNHTFRNEMKCPSAALCFQLLIAYTIHSFIINSIALQNYAFTESKFILYCTYYLLVRRRNIKTNRKKRIGWHGSVY